MLYEPPCAPHTWSVYVPVAGASYVLEPTVPKFVTWFVKVFVTSVSVVSIQLFSPNNSGYLSI